MKPLRVIARSSALSVMQVREVFSCLPTVDYRLTTTESIGDKNRHISLMDNVPGDFFTREADEAVRNGEADMAVHSAKDLPYPLPPGLEVVALFEAFDKTDSLVCRDKLILSQLPSGARIGTSSAARRAELLKERSDLEVVSIRGTIEERIALVDSGQIDALIVATCALKRLGLENRISQILPFKTHALQGCLAVTGRIGDKRLKALFGPLDVRKKYGEVTLVGFGPGNPDLLTIAGQKALEQADVIFYDDLIDKTFTCNLKAEKIYVGKRKNHHSHSQDEINEMVYQAAISGKNAVRLKGGDPMIFAHGREEIDYLQSRLVKINVIPGISAATAAAAFTHIPLTHRDISSSVAFITGHATSNAGIPEADTLVYYMAGTTISEIAKKLVAAGRHADTPVALVYHVSHPDQKIFYSSLKELQFSVINYPTPLLVIIGAVVGFENGSVRQTALITGTTAKCYSSPDKIIHTPLIKIEKITPSAITQTIDIARFNWIIFTSRYGVCYFFDLLKEMRFDGRKLASIQIGSVGKTTTAELNKRLIYPDLESATGSSEGILNYFRDNHLSGKHILLPRSNKGLQSFSEGLRALGNHVTDFPVYTNTFNDNAAKVNLSDLHKIVFSSPSCVHAFKRLYGNLPSGIQLIAKGLTTENAIREDSIKPPLTTVSP
ncbi:MAG: uroporphyrinogen-III C-methyltransferase [Tannerella sp.]|jgi:uroporphyrinogen III methyltransferase/synthase|nr:uroporphyrinogen-III C-methyltransferase [Tannerella sp.]